MVAIRLACCFLRDLGGLRSGQFARHAISDFLAGDHLYRLGAFIAAKHEIHAYVMQPQPPVHHIALVMCGAKP